jgi:hypothetical protein
MTIPEEPIQNVAFCPHCGNTAPQKLVFSHSYESSGYDTITGEKDEGGPPCTYYVAICSTCNEVLLYHSFFDENPDEYFSKSTLLYPNNHQLPNSVPNSIQQAYVEACRIQFLAPNAYAVMLRRALEAVCDDRSVPTGTLHKRLEVLVERGELPAKLAEMTSILRMLGNAGAHHSSSPVIVPMTWGMNEFFRAIIEYVYIAPSKIEAFKRTMDRSSTDNESSDE